MKTRFLVVSAFLALAAALPLCSALRADDAPVHPAPIPVKPGWTNTKPPDLVTIKSAFRCNVFMVGDPIGFTLTPSTDALTYEVRDYWGNLVDQGKTADSISIKTQPPGWYKLYIYGIYGKNPAKEAPKAPVQDTGSLVFQPPTTAKPASPAEVDRAAWGDSIGGTTFVVFRKNPNFPALPGKDVVRAGLGDEIMRGVTGMGPQRHYASDDKVDQAIKDLEPEIAQVKEYYMPYDPIRKRVIFASFSNGTKNTAGVYNFVDHFKNDIEYWEPRNEPNGGSNGTNFVTNEMKPFYDTVKSVSPNLKVIGPGTVSIGPDGGGIRFIEDFLKAGGADDIDGFSFHIYNGINGDLMMGRKSLDTLMALLKQYNADTKELWQTEQGFFACIYGSYQPRHQAQWTMLEMMLFEQYHLPKEHNDLWYDTSHGFWDFPTWWENDDSSLNPIVPLMRVYSEEVFGTTFNKAYDFGPVGNKLYLGSLFAGADRNVAVFQSAGDPNGQIELNVTGGDKLHVSSAFGVEQDIPVVNGKATLPVPELPVWVDLAKGQTIDVVPMDWGDNLALQPDVVADAMDQPPDVLPDNEDFSKNDPSAGGFTSSPAPLINNGEFENWYYSQKADSTPWEQVVEQFPTWIRLTFPKPTEISRVIIYATVPWQKQGTLLDYELQYWDGTAWKTIDHVKEDPKTFGVFTPVLRCTVDSFFSDRSIFQHQFKPVTTDKIRLLVHMCTYGGGATKLVSEAGGQAFDQPCFGIREIEVYDK